MTAGPLSTEAEELAAEVVSLAMHRNGARPDVRPLTDIGNAERLVDRHGDDLRFVPQLGWLAWDGDRWKLDEDGEPMRRAQETARSIQHEADTAGDNDLRKALRRHAAMSESRSRLEAALELATVDRRIVASPAALDADPWALNVSSGTLDLRTGRLRPHDRGDLITKLAPVLFDPDAIAPLWMSVVDRVSANDREWVAFLRRAIGYSLTGLTSEQVVFFCVGAGANGKSTLLESVRRLLGDYALHTAAETLIEQRRSSGPRPELVRLQGARLVTAAETSETAPLNEALVKQVTGGEPVTARAMYAKREIEFAPTFKLWLATNHAPKIRGADEGIWRRIHRVPFRVTIPEAERDAELGEKLAQELPGILTWALAGCLEWQSTRLDAPESVTSATAAYRAEMDDLGEFIDELCVVSDNAKVRTATLYTAYDSWAKAAGMEPLPIETFGKRLGARGLQPGKVDGHRGWLGIGLKGVKT